jgi:hypothetical protein
MVAAALWLPFSNQYELLPSRLFKELQAGGFVA